MWCASVPGLQTETLKQEQGRLQHILQHQKFTPADIERINHEKRELQQTISSLSKSLEDAEQHMWKEEIALAKAKEMVRNTPEQNQAQSSF